MNLLSKLISIARFKLVFCINKTGFSEEDFLSFTNNGQSVNNNRPNNNVGKGFQEGQSGGINFIQNKTKNTDINASYFLSNQDVEQADGWIAPKT